MSYDFESFLSDPTGDIQRRDDEEEFVKDELNELINRPHQYVRRKVRQQVDDCLWLEDLKAHTNMLLERKVYRDKTLNRCIKCTLPLGTCKHKNEWETQLTLQNQSTFKQKKQYERFFKETEDEMIGGARKAFSPIKDKVAEQMDDMFDIIGGGVVVDTQPVAEDVDIERIRWYHFQPRLSDKIGDTYFVLSAPSPRGWHSCVPLGKYIVVFGGFRFMDNKIPQPFQTALQGKEVEYLNDTFVYDTVNCSWHHPKPEGLKPPGRYGHVAAAIDDNRMAIFGGRSEGGKFLQDTWLFDVKSSEWTGPLYGDEINPAPAPRAFAGCFSKKSTDLLEHEPMKMYLFGGTDGLDNYGDLWMLKQGRQEGNELKDFQWERAVAIGFTPIPRYGHRLISIGGDLAVVLGGCSVSPQSEISIADAGLEETRKLFTSSDALEEAYRREGELPVLAGKAMSKSLGDLRSMVSHASVIAGEVQALEAQTRNQEIALADEFYQYQARSRFAAKTAMHANKELDIVFLNIRDLTWQEPAKGEIRGNIPSCRMHFSAAFVGHYVLVSGGTPPTSLAYRNCDIEYSRAYALDVYTMRWIEPPPLQTSNYYDTPLQIAEADIMRAKTKMEEEKLRGLSKGVRGGKTPGYAEAEAVLEICKWRKNMLLNEKGNFRAPPKPRWGGTLCEMGQRALLVGGWGETEVTSSEEHFVIDLEPELERNRRMEDEFEAKLERDRIADETANYADMLSANYEKRAMAAAERSNQARERELMAIEEIRCCVPPLSQPPSVRLVKASHNCIWVEWDAPKKKANGDKLTKEELSNVSYILWCSGGYERLYEGDRVIVTMKITVTIDKNKIGGDKDDESFSDDSDDSSDSDAHDNDTITETGENSKYNKKMKKMKTKTKLVDYHGEISVARLNGLFDITFDDGTILNNHPRSQIRKETYKEPRVEPISHISAQKSASKKAFRERFSRWHHDRMAAKAQEEKEFQTRKKKLMVDIRKKRRYIDDHSPVSNPEVYQPRPSFTPTEKTPPECRLLYHGKDCFYDCESLVPDEALIRELPAPRSYNQVNDPIIPTASVEVTFFVQTLGTEYPIHEPSLLSLPATFTTKPNPMPWNGTGLPPPTGDDQTITTGSVLSSADSIPRPGLNVTTTGDDESGSGTHGPEVDLVLTRRNRLESVVRIAEDDVADKSNLLEIEDITDEANSSLAEPGSPSRYARLNMNALEGEWSATEKTMKAQEEEHRRFVEAQTLLEASENADGSCLVRKAKVSVMQIGISTVTGEGISNHYV